MASSGGLWQVEEEATVLQTFREVFHALPVAMQRMPKDPSRKWPLIKQIAEKVHSQLPQWLQDDRSMNAIKFRVPLAWNELKQEEVQRLKDENGTLTTAVQAARVKEQDAHDKMRIAYAKHQEDAQSARVKEQEANEKMRAAYARHREDAAKATQMSHEIEGLKRIHAEEVGRREETNILITAEMNAKNALLYESGQALWKIMSHLQATALPCQAVRHPEIQRDPSQLRSEEDLGQPASTTFDAQFANMVSDNVLIGAAWSMPIGRVPKKRRISLSVTEIMEFGLDDPEI
jgi:hypothetical protein